MPYKLRKAPKRELYWVVTTETGKKHSKDPIPKDKAKAQKRILESALNGSGKVTQKKLLDLVKEYKEVTARLEYEYNKLVNYAIENDLETMDTLSLPVAKQYKNLLSRKEEIRKEHTKWLSIEKKEAQDSIQEVEEDERPPGTEAAQSGISAVRMLRKKPKSGTGKALHGGITPEAFQELTNNFTARSLSGEERPDVVWQQYKVVLGRQISNEQANRQEKIMTLVTTAIQELASGVNHVDGMYTVTAKTWKDLWTALFPEEKAVNISERLGFSFGKGKGKKRKAPKCLKGGMKYDKLEQLKNMINTNITDNFSVAPNNPLALTYRGDLRDEKLQRILDFIMANTDANDKKRLGIQLPGEPPVPADTIPIFELLDFSFNGIYSDEELYRRVVRWFPSQKPILGRTFHGYRLYINHGLIQHLFHILENHLFEQELGRPGRNPPKEFRPPPPRKEEEEDEGGAKTGGAACKPPYHDYSKGKASVFALTCIDPRYTYDAAYFLQHKKELHQDYDLFTLAGASVGASKKEWTKSFFDNLELGIKLHGIKEVWCFDHLDCGMYKATFGLKDDLDPKIHIDCMEKLRKLIKKKHPELKFRSFLIDAKGHVSSV